MFTIFSLSVYHFLRHIFVLRNLPAVSIEPFAELELFVANAGDKLEVIFFVGE